MSLPYEVARDCVVVVGALPLGYGDFFLAEVESRSYKQPPVPRGHLASLEQRNAPVTSAVGIFVKQRSLFRLRVHQGVSDWDLGLWVGSLGL
jgi:hypothetical protein